MMARVLLHHRAVVGDGVGDTGRLGGYEKDNPFIDLLAARIIIIRSGHFQDRFVEPVSEDLFV
jgi:hypothetical protein